MADYRRVDFSEYWGITGRIKKGYTKSKSRNLINDDFQGSDLQEASFEELYLVDFNFNRADLRGAKFRNSKLENVTIDDAEVGITQWIQKFLKAGIYAVAFMSAITCIYSIAYFLWLFNDLPHEIPDLVGTGFILASYLGAFIFLVYRCFEHGIDGYFPALLLIIPLGSFVYHAVTSDIQATLPLFGLIFFVGTLGGMFAQSQVKYLSKELSFISELSVSSDWLNSISLLGLILGTFLSIGPDPDFWGFREVSTNLLAGFFGCCGYLLGEFTRKCSI
jgi:hypothetical protein